MTRRRLLFPALVGNEFRKPFHRAGTIVMFGLVWAACVLTLLFGWIQQSYLANQNGDGTKATDSQILTFRIEESLSELDMQREYLEGLRSGKATYPGYEPSPGEVVPTLSPKEMEQQIRTTESYIDQLESSVALDRYRLEKGLPVDDSQSAMGFAASQGWLVQLLTLFAVVLGAIGVAGEFSGGTIRLLLTRPFRRWKILLSKYLGVYGVVLCMLAGAVSLSVVSGVVLYGFTSAPYLVYAGGAVRTVPMVWVVLGKFALACVSLLMFSTLAFTISSVFRTSALAIGISLFLMFVGNTATSIVTSLGTFLDSAFLKFLAKISLFSYMDLSPYVFRQPEMFAMRPEVGLGFALAVLAAYYAVFMAVAFAGFARRDVT